MLNVSQAVKNAYANPSSAKTLVVYFPTLDYTVNSEDVSTESFSLSETIMDSKEIQFVGCTPSKMQIQIQNFGEDVKGLPITVSVYTDTTTSEPVTLFNGVVDTVTQQSNKKIKELVAYDVLYTKGNTDIASWYLSIMDAEENISLKDFRDSLFEYLDIDVVSTTLVNDSMLFTKQYSPVNMKALDIIKYICQINGVFGIINRYGQFEFRQLTPISSATAVVIGYYKNIEYQEFTVKPVDKLTIRQSNQVEGVSVGSGTNNYIIQGNFFTSGLEDTDLLTLATNVYPNVQYISYVPYKVVQNAYPWLECGDVVSYQVYDFEASQTQGTDVYTTMKFYIFERYISGIQAFRDTYEAQGEEYASVFLSDINAKIETLQEQIENISGKLNSLSLKYVMFYNERAIDIGDGESKVVASNEFAVSQPSQVRIELEYLIECTTSEAIIDDVVFNQDLKVKVLYEYDGTIIDSRQPIETYQDGKHILKTYYIINVPDAQAHSWRVFLQCEDGSVHIDVLQAQNTIFGLGTLVGDLWDGQIRADDDIDALTFGLFTPSAIAESVSFEQHTPSENNITSIIPAITFGDITQAYTDSVSIEDDYFYVWAYDWLSTYTCNVVDGIWSGAGTVTTVDITLSNTSDTVVADSSNDVTYAISFDSGTTWYGWTGSDWQEDFEMALSTFNSIPSFLSTTIMIRATLISVSTLKDIKIYGGTI